MAASCETLLRRSTVPLPTSFTRCRSNPETVVALLAKCASSAASCWATASAANMRLALLEFNLRRAVSVRATSFQRNTAPADHHAAVRRAVSSSTWDGSTSRPSHAVGRMDDRAAIGFHDESAPDSTIITGRTPVRVWVSTAGCDVGAAGADFVQAGACSIGGRAALEMFTLPGGSASDPAPWQPTTKRRVRTRVEILAMGLADEIVPDLEVGESRTRPRCGRTP